MPQTLNMKLSWRPLGHLLTSAALQLLTTGVSLSLFPTLTPPLNVVVNGERKTMVTCAVNEPADDKEFAFRFSNGKGSKLKSFTYQIPREDDRSFSTVSQLSIHTDEFHSWDTIICYVTQNETSDTWNTTSLLISEERTGDPCLDESQRAQNQASSTEVPYIVSQILLLLAIRTLLFKFLLFDVLMTCCILHKRKSMPLYLMPHNCPAVHSHIRSAPVPEND